MPLVLIPRQYATRAGIEIQAAWLDDVEAICRQFSVRANSGYRTKAQNEAAGGAGNSDHLRGDAVDFTGGSRDLLALHEWASGRFPYVEPMTQAKNHVHISFRHAGVSAPATPTKKALKPLAGAAFVKALKASCARHNVGWLAAAGVGIPEGASGKIGDSGSSYGPWQLHIGGALPKRWARLGKNNPDTNAWAWSAPGIEYAIAGMAKAGAAGQRGDIACRTIVYHFEHPAHPATETANAQKARDQLEHGKPSPEAAVAAWFQGPQVGGGLPGYTPPPARPAVQVPRAAGAWALLMRTMGRNVPAQVGRTRTVAGRLRQAVK